jgi:hypothetical protein
MFSTNNSSNNSSNKDNNPIKKMSRSMVILTSVVFVVGTFLFGINYWQSTRCGNSKTIEEMQTYIDSIQNRILHAESETLRNAFVMEKMIVALQNHLYKLETKELNDLSLLSQEESIKIQLSLASQPAPPFIEYELDPKYYDAELIADVIDSALSKDDDDNKKDDGNDFSGNDISSEPIISDAEALKKCSLWKEQYSVIKGVSWGNLPFDLQNKWMQYQCDVHLVE